MPTVLASGAFDDLRSRDVRFLEEAVKLGRVTVGLWTDDLVRAREKKPPKFPFDERRYLLQAMRYVTDVVPVGDLSPAGLRAAFDKTSAAICVADERSPWPELGDWCGSRGLEFRTLASASLAGFPPPPPLAVDDSSDKPRVVVTGCYDWFHSGHVRFFEEAAAFGDLYVGVGSDANLRLLKGEGHPQFPQDERAYMVQSARQVKQAFVATCWA